MEICLSIRLCLIGGYSPLLLFPGSYLPFQLHTFFLEMVTFILMNNKCLPRFGFGYYFNDRHKCGYFDTLLIINRRVGDLRGTVLTQRSDPEASPHPVVMSPTQAGFSLQPYKGRSCSNLRMVACCPWHSPHP